MKHGFVETENFVKMQETIDTLKMLEAESFDSARIALFYGPFGIGKTWAIEKIAINEPKNIVFLRAEEVWTKSYLVKKLGVEFGCERKTIAETFEALKDVIRVDERIIIVDEVDTLLKAEKMKLLEMLRDLTDQTSCVLIFIGMENAPLKWEKYGHYFSRVRKVKMEKTCEKDIKAFCKLCNIEIKKDLVIHFFEKFGNLRLVKREIEEIEEYADLSGLEFMNLELYKEMKIESKG